MPMYVYYANAHATNLDLCVWT